MLLRLSFSGKFRFWAPPYGFFGRSRMSPSTTHRPFLSTSDDMAGQFFCLCCRMRLFLFHRFGCVGQRDLEKILHASTSFWTCWVGKLIGFDVPLAASGRLSPQHEHAHRATTSPGQEIEPNESDLAVSRERRINRGRIRRLFRRLMMCVWLLRRLSFAIAPAVARK